MDIPAQTDPLEHTYSGATLLHAQYTIDSADSSCTLEYVCVPPTSGTDLCAIGYMDAISGIFRLTTTDKIGYPPGTYSVEIQGYIVNYPSQTASHAFTYTLVDPCSSATVIVPDPHSDPPKHAYRGPTSFQAEYTASDTSCSVEYKCEVPASGTDLCALGSID